MERQKQTFERTTSVLKKRVLAHKPYPRGLFNALLSEFPHYDSYKGGQRLRNILNGVTTDIDVTEAIERLVPELKEREQQSKE